MRALVLGVLLSIPAAAAERGARSAAPASPCEVTLTQSEAHASRPLRWDDLGADGCVVALGRALAKVRGLRSVTVATSLEDTLRAKQKNGLAQAEAVATALAGAGIPRSQISTVAPLPRGDDDRTLRVRWTTAPRGAPLARISQVAGAARLIGPGGRETPVASAVELYAWDRIETGPASSLTLSLQDGSRARLEENGAVELTPDEAPPGGGAGKARLEVLRGGLELWAAPSASGLAFTAGSARGLANHTHFTLNRLSADALTVASWSGQVRLLAGEREVLVPPGSSALISPAAPPEPQPLTDAPIVREPLFGKVGRRSTFSWEPLHGVASYRVELSRTPDFSGERHVLRATSSSLSGELEEGRWYWRVLATPPDGPTSRPSKIHAFEVRSAPTG